MYKDLSSHEYKNFCTPRTSGIVDTTREQILRYILYLFSEDRIILNTYLTKKLTQRFNLSRYQVYRIIRQLEKHGAIRKNVISKKLYEIELVDPRVLVDLKVTTFEVPFEEGKVVVFTIPESQVIERTPIIKRTPTIVPTPTPPTTTTPIPTPTPTPSEQLTERLQILINPKPAKVGEVVTIKVVKGDGTPISGAYVGYIEAARAIALGYTITQLTGDILLAIKVAMRYAEQLGLTNSQGEITTTFDKAGEYIIIAWKGVGTGGAESLLVKPRLSIRR